MEELYYFSPSKCSFYPESLRDMYETAGSWPDDSYIIPLEIYQHFQNLPAGFKLGVQDGKPIPVPVEGPSLSELAENADKIANKLIDSARRSIDVLQYGIDVGMSIEGDEEKITALKQYVVGVSRHHLQPTYPQKVIWPSHPLK